jgi:hypothetical protein
MQVCVGGSRDRRRAIEGPELPSDRIRDRANGADPVPRVEPTWSARGLRREPAGLPGAQPTRRCQHKMQRFKSPGSAQRLLSVHAAVHNTFNVQRHSPHAPRSASSLRPMTLVRSRVQSLPNAELARSRPNIATPISTRCPSSARLLNCSSLTMTRSRRPVGRSRNEGATSDPESSDRQYPAGRG